jgi:hypothetical protein
MGALNVGGSVVGFAQSCDPNYPTVCVPPGTMLCEEDPWLSPGLCEDPCLDPTAIHVDGIKIPDACLPYLAN